MFWILIILIWFILNNIFYLWKWFFKSSLKWILCILNLNWIFIFLMRMNMLLVDLNKFLFLFLYNLTLFLFFLFDIFFLSYISLLAILIINIFIFIRLNLYCLNFILIINQRKIRIPTMVFMLVSICRHIFEIVIIVWTN